MEELNKENLKVIRLDNGEILFSKLKASFELFEKSCFTFSSIIKSTDILRNLIIWRFPTILFNEGTSLKNANKKTPNNWIIEFKP